MNSYRNNLSTHDLIQITTFYTFKLLYKSLCLISKALPTVGNIILFGGILCLLIATYFYVGTVLYTGFLLVLPFLIVCGKVGVLLTFFFALSHAANKNLNGF